MGMVSRRGSMGGATPFTSVLLWWNWDASKLGWSSAQLFTASWFNEDHQTVPDSHLFLLLLLPLLRVASVSCGNHPCSLCARIVRSAGAIRAAACKLDG